MPKRHKMQRLFWFFFIIPTIVSAQNPRKDRKEQQTIVDNLRKHVVYLSDDRLEGRRTGTDGERLASEYIAEQFKKNGLVTFGDKGEFFQSFKIDDGKKVESGAVIIVNGKIKLYCPADFHPLSNSPSAMSVTIDYNPIINEKGNVWRLDVSDLLESNSQNPHFDVNVSIREKIVKMSSLGAKAVLVTQTRNSGYEHVFNPKDKTETLPIPAFYVGRKVFMECFNDTLNDTEIIIDYHISPTYRNGRNVIGWIDNKSAKYMVIGAHFDHLGYGEDGNSMLRTPERAVHNGADDNASGTAAMIELSRLIGDRNLRTHNYIFVAFSGEELGLYGSKYFVENPPFGLDKTTCMINLDMVGRLNDTTRTMTIGGYGTAKQWPEILKADKTDPGFKYRIDSSGSGPSDHTSFYRKDIPVLFFFTGLHTDYHKPTDDHEKINFRGTKDIVRFIRAVVNRTANYSNLDFQKTREQQTGTSTRFTVSMGIMPDYTYTGAGVRVDGLSDGRPAKSVGIKTGDVVVKLGDKEVDSVESYMKALSGFKKGDKTKVVVKRGTDLITFDIGF